MSWFSFYQWIILFIIFTKNEIRCGRLHCSVNLFRHSFQYHKKITVVKEIFPNYPPSSSRPLTLTLPPEQHPIRPSSRRFIFDPLHFFNIVDRVPKISVRAFCPLLARSVKTCTTTIGWNGLVPFREKKPYNGIENMLMTVYLLRHLSELKVHWIYATVYIAARTPDYRWVYSVACAGIWGEGETQPIDRLSALRATFGWRGAQGNFGSKCLPDSWKWHFPGLFTAYKFGETLAIL